MVKYLKTTDRDIVPQCDGDLGLQLHISNWMVDFYHVYISVIKEIWQHLTPIKKSLGLLKGIWLKGRVFGIPQRSPNKAIIYFTGEPTFDCTCDQIMVISSSRWQDKKGTATIKDTEVTWLAWMVYTCGNIIKGMRGEAFQKYFSIGKFNNEILI